jgi:hypothetical protein
MARYGRAGGRGPKNYRHRSGGPSEDDGTGFCFAVVVSMALVIGGIVYIVESFDDKRQVNLEGNCFAFALARFQRSHTLLQCLGITSTIGHRFIALFLKTLTSL